MKKKFFKSLSILLAVMMMAFSVMTASADDTQFTLTMPSTPTSATYAIYLVAPATLDGGTYVYNSVETDFSLSGALTAEGGTLKHNGTDISSVSFTATNLATLANALVAASGSATPVEGYSALAAGASATLKPGYYLIVPSDGQKISAPILKAVTSNTSIAESKSSDLTVTKTIEKVNGNTDTDISTDKHAATVGSTDTDTDQVVNYKIETQFPKYDSGVKGIKNFVIVDHPDAGITINKTTSTAYDNVTVKVGGTPLTKDTHYTIADDGTGFKITFKDSCVLAHQGETVTVEFPATISANVTYTNGVADLDNTAIIGYDNNYYSQSTENDADTEEGDTSDTDTATVYEAEITVIKTFDDVTNNAGSPSTMPSPAPQFKLYNADGYAKTITVNEGMWDATSGGFKFSFQGLHPGTYTLEEIVVPTGYKKAPNKTITITATEQNGSYSYSFVGATDGTITINNEKGTSLPGTGGMGTVIFTVAGIGIVLLAGVMFIIYMKKRRIED